MTVGKIVPVAAPVARAVPIPLGECTCKCLICTRPEVIDSDEQCSAWFDAIMETWNESDMEASFLTDELEGAMLALAAHGDVAAASRAHKALRIVREWRRS